MTANGAYGPGAEAMAAAAADRAISEDLIDRSLLRLSNGVVLRVRPVSPLLLRRATIHVEDPRPPVVYIEAKGREEENPNDPDYLAALAAATAARGLAAMNVVMATGLSVESLPDGIDAPEDGGWLEELDAAEVPYDASTAAKRFRLWCETVALRAPTVEGSREDALNLSTATLRMMGLTEEEVDRAVESFRGDEGRGGAAGLPLPATAADGDRVPPARGGPRARDRGA